MKRQHKKQKQQSKPQSNKQPLLQQAKAISSKTLVLLRGPSGSGKSTIAKHLSPSVDCICEADMFYEGEIFDPDLLGQAHAWCKRRAEILMYRSARIVIVSNTSVKVRDLRPYLRMAEAHDYAVEIIRSPGPWNIDELFLRNKHNTPREIIERHIKEYVIAEGELEWEDLSIFNE